MNEIKPILFTKVRKETVHRLIGKLWKAVGDFEDVSAKDLIPRCGNCVGCWGKDWKEGEAKILGDTYCIGWNCCYHESLWMEIENEDTMLPEKEFLCSIHGKKNSKYTWREIAHHIIAAYEQAKEYAKLQSAKNQKTEEEAEQVISE